MRRRCWPDWSDKTLEQAALTYTRHYATQRVTDPVALFRKLIIDATGKDRGRGQGQPPASRGRYAAELERRRRG